MTNPTPNDAPTAVRIARTHRTWPEDRCLNRIWHCFGQNYGANSAIEMWSRTGNTTKHKDLNPPAGVPVYFSMDYQKFGHVALSMGGGIVSSTDYPSKGLVGDVPLLTIIARWRMTYLGWATEFGGPILHIPGVANPVAGPAATRPSLTIGSIGPAVKELQSILLRLFPTYATPIASNGGADGVYGRYTANVVSEFQRRAGLYVDGVCGKQTWAAIDRLVP